jgi:pimeloyl-ACP methyl ester carboxylesterase
VRARVWEGGLRLARGVALGQRRALTSRYGEDADARSHGESFVSLFQSRFVPGGLYLLDEPEAPLSPQRQLALLAMRKGMAEQVAIDMPSAAEIAACKWLTDEELKVYASEYGRNGFQGGLQSYRVGRVPRLSAETQLFAGRTIDVPSLFLSGKSDWGVYQRAGSLDNMKRSCTKFEGVELIDGAGHWVQQEKSAQVAERLIKFVQR